VGKRWLHRGTATEQAEVEDDNERSEEAASKVMMENEKQQMRAEAVKSE